LQTSAVRRGIQPAIGKNMVIVEADRKQVNSPADLKKIVDGRKPGDSVLLRLRTERGHRSWHCRFRNSARLVPEGHCPAPPCGAVPFLVPPQSAGRRSGPA